MRGSGMTGYFYQHEYEDNCMESILGDATARVDVSELIWLLPRSL